MHSPLLSQFNKALLPPPQTSKQAYNQQGKLQKAAQALQNILAKPEGKRQ